MLKILNSNISNFKTGAELGPDTIFHCEATGFVGIRGGGYAIRSIDPLMLIFSRGSIYKSESCGVHVDISMPENLDLKKSKN
jgi:hypothetical protein